MLQHKLAARAAIREGRSRDPRRRERSGRRASRSRRRASLSGVWRGCRPARLRTPAHRTVARFDNRAPSTKGTLHQLHEDPRRAARRGRPSPARRRFGDRAGAAAPGDRDLHCRPRSPPSLAARVRRSVTGSGVSPTTPKASTPRRGGSYSTLTPARTRCAFPGSRRRSCAPSRPSAPRLRRSSAYSVPCLAARPPGASRAS